ncbi:sulfur oxidation c-type cytochrome SoxX [Sulfurivermis fontis]|jgi:sulfur-oxidizing protein SoxX|uniref:sulfur oxidation c-type cytochrome SoxX n=1 Tax=Sulfurivermis fontis TaxID=1972068 RepID=UPI000FDBD80D|nr:sulfur oxidation c-type cytochrome SoxX [Sulfurivermis fontis]
MFKIITTVGALALLVAGAGAIAADRTLPSNLLYDASTPNKTLWPKPIANSGELKYENHRQDLSRWPSLSYEETLPTRRPEPVQAPQPLNGDPARGKEIATTTTKGNCHACHLLPGDAQGGTAGPPLVRYSQHGRDTVWTYQQVFDPRINNPNTAMPPYGTNEVLSTQEIADVVAYLMSLQ